MKKLTVLLAVMMLAVSFSQPAQAQEKINNPTDVAIKTISGTTPSADAVQRAILLSCPKRGWVCSQTEPGVIKAILNIRKHVAEVEITYSTSEYSIKYVDSEELRYDEAKQTIHRNYNRWITNLVNDLNAAFLALD